MIAILADVHGNYPALKAVLDEIDSLGCKTIISLGDVAGYYCMINECIREMRSRNIINLMGNHDSYLVSNKRCPRSNSANYCLKYQEKIIFKENLEWLRNSRPSLLLDGISFVHGGWADPVDEYLYEITSDYFSGKKGSYFVSGHTHVQVLAKLKHQIYCNPGSVGQPRDGDRRAAYAIYNHGIFTLKRVDYNIDVIALEMENAKFEPYYYQNLFIGSRIGGTFSAVTVGG